VIRNAIIADAVRALESDVARFAERLNGLEALASKAREDGRQLDRVHVALLEHVRGLHTLATRACAQVRETSLLEIGSALLAAKAAQRERPTVGHDSGRSVRRR
jgi:hypothetical protein